MRKEKIKEIIKDKKIQCWVLNAVAALTLISLGFVIGFYVPSKPLDESEFQKMEKIAQDVLSGKNEQELPIGYSKEQSSEFHIFVTKDGYAGGVNATLMGKFVLANRDNGIVQRVTNGMRGIIISLIVVYFGFLINPWTYKVLLN